MGNVAIEMESMCAGILNSHAQRNKSLKDLHKNVKSLRNDARKFVADTRRFRQEMAKSLNGTLEKDREDLARDVDSLRKDFCESQKGLHSDLVSASKAWEKMSKMLKGNGVK